MGRNIVLLASILMLSSFSFLSSMSYERETKAIIAREAFSKAEPLARGWNDDAFLVK